MINKKLDDILQDISILKDIFNNKEYFKKIEEATERQNKWNNELIEKVNNLQSKIDKAIEEIEYFELQAKHLDDNIYLDETLTNKLLDILEEDKNAKNN